MIIRVELYGRLRDAGLGDSIAVEVTDRATARQVLAAVSAQLEGKDLLQGAALATEGKVLGHDEEVPVGGRLAALPPVCGG